MKAALLSACVLPLALHAATISPTEAALRAALASESEIFFSSSGIIPLSAPLEVNRDVLIYGGDHNITIDGQNTHTILVIHATRRVTLRNLTLINGRSRGADGDAFSTAGKQGNGGAIHNLGGELTIQACALTNNTAAGGNAYLPFFGVIPDVGGPAYGGAIYQTSGSATIVGSTFQNNRATGGNGLGNGFARGGAIYATDGTVSVSDSTFSGNTTLGGTSAGRELPGGDGSGGAIYTNGADLTVGGSTFRVNSAIATYNSPAYGGAIFAQSGSVTIENSLFQVNSADGGRGVYWRGQLPRPGEPGRGGAIYLGPGAIPNIRSSTFDANLTRGGQNYIANFPGDPEAGASSQGGAIFISELAAIMNCTFHANAAFNYRDSDPASGGAIESLGSADLQNVTFAANHCVGPIINVATASNIKATIFGPHTGAQHFAGPITDDGFNISSDNTPAFTQTTSVNNTDPNLGPLENWDGQTPTIPILHGSPAIDRVTDNAAPATDQRGRSRPYGAHPDAGAFESSPPYYILGQLHGVIPPDTEINAGAIFGPGNEGRFILSNIPPGPYSFTITGANTVFRPNPANLNIQADTVFNARGFSFQSFAWDPDFGVPTYSFGGRAGETWDFFASYNLIEWFPAGTQTFATEGVHSIALNQFNNPVFLKGVRR